MSDDPLGHLKWLRDLAAGDQVVVLFHDDRNLAIGARSGKVIKVTTTQIVIAMQALGVIEARFNRSNGVRRGDHTEVLVRPDDPAVLAIKKHNRLLRLAHDISGAISHRDTLTPVAIDHVEDMIKKWRLES